MKSWMNSSHHRRPMEMFSCVSLPNSLLHPRTTEVIVIIQFYFLLLTASNFLSACFTSAFYCVNFESIKYTNVDWRLVISGGAQGGSRKSIRKMWSLLYNWKKGSNRRMFMNVTTKGTKRSISTILQAQADLSRIHHILLRAFINEIDSA